MGDYIHKHIASTIRYLKKDKCLSEKGWLIPILRQGIDKMNQYVSKSSQNALRTSSYQIGIWNSRCESMSYLWMKFTLHWDFIDSRWYVYIGTRQNPPIHLTPTPAQIYISSSVSVNDLSCTYLWRAHSFELRRKYNSLYMIFDSHRLVLHTNIWIYSW